MAETEQATALAEVLGRVNRPSLNDGGRCAETASWLPMAHALLESEWWASHETGPRVGTLDKDERCNRCGGENVIWSAPSPLWNLVMRGNDINADTIYHDLVCIRCFIVLAEEAGVAPKRWRIYADPEPEGLIYTTPSGRVWDADRWLWVEDDKRRCSCGNDFDGDNLCMPSACQWEGIERADPASAGKDPS